MCWHTPLVQRDKKTCGESRPRNKCTCSTARAPGETHGYSWDQKGIEMCQHSFWNNRHRSAKRSTAKNKNRDMAAQILKQCNRHSSAKRCKQEQRMSWTGSVKQSRVSTKSHTARQKPHNETMERRPVQNHCNCRSSNTSVSTRSNDCIDVKNTWQVQKETEFSCLQIFKTNKQTTTTIKNKKKTKFRHLQIFKKSSDNN